MQFDLECIATTPVHSEEISEFSVVFLQVPGKSRNRTSAVSAFAQNFICTISAFIKTWLSPMGPSRVALRHPASQHATGEIAL